VSERVRQVVEASSTLKGAAYAFVVAIADQADDDGFCWVGDPKLAARARISDRTIRNVRGKAEEAGELACLRARGRGRHHLYRVLVGQPQGAGAREELERYVLDRFDALGHLLPKVKPEIHATRPASPQVRKPEIHAVGPAEPEPEADGKPEIGAASPQTPLQGEVLPEGVGGGFANAQPPPTVGDNGTVIPLRSGRATQAVLEVVASLKAEVEGGRRSWSFSEAAKAAWCRLLDDDRNLSTAQQFVAWYVAEMRGVDVRELERLDWSMAGQKVKRWRSLTLYGVDQAVTRGLEGIDFWKYVEAVCQRARADTKVGGGGA
jgi:hypothetical protein